MSCKILYIESNLYCRCHQGTNLPELGYLCHTVPLPSVTWAMVKDVTVFSLNGGCYDTLPCIFSFCFCPTVFFCHDKETLHLLCCPIKIVELHPSHQCCCFETQFSPNYLLHIHSAFYWNFWLDVHSEALSPTCSGKIKPRSDTWKWLSGECSL